MSQNFWEMIQGRYRYSTGGVGNGEMFRQPYTQILSMATNPTPTLNETCCAYNLAKLTRDLNCFDPGDARYMDYYERVLYNQLVGSLHSTCYLTIYHYAVGLNASKPWGNRTPQSTCCGGTGSENHVKYQEATYFVSENTLWVALYMPTVLQWDAKGVTIQQDCLWPAESATIRVTDGKANFEMKLRVPYWATEGFDIRLNGVPVASSYQPSSYVTIPARDWTDADIVEVIMPFGKHIDYGPDKMETATTGENQPDTQFDPMWAGTIMYGPLAMTATGVNSWEEARLAIDPSLNNIVLNGPGGGSNGTDGNLYTLTVGDRTFEPDYYRDKNSTHYFRIDLVDDLLAEFRKMLSEKLQEATVFRPENYSKESYEALKASVEAGRELSRSEQATQEQIVDQIAAIGRSVQELQSAKLDKSQLSEAIQEAETKEEKDFTWDKYLALRMAITAAKEVEKTGESQLAVDKQILLLRKAVKDLVLANSVDKSYLGEVLDLAIERKKTQDAWNALTIKIPEYSPWAPHAFRRLVYQLGESQKVYENKDKNYSQNEVNLAASALNAAINTMRPGNLPEPEDLYPLSTLLRQADRLPSKEMSQDVIEAIEYARMVVFYVNDGSGTHDMIQNATDKLKEAIN